MLNKKIRSAINKYAYQRGLEHYEVIRAELLSKSKAMERTGTHLQAIIKALGIPMPQIDENNASEELK